MAIDINDLDPGKRAAEIPKPSIGRIVRYVDSMGKSNAAIVTLAQNTTVNLQVLPDQGYIYTAANVRYDDVSQGISPMSWHWPPRD